MNGRRWEVQIRGQDSLPTKPIQIAKYSDADSFTPTFTSAERSEASVGSCLVKLKIVVDSVYAVILSMNSNLVIDTGVFVSALIGSQGPSSEVIRKCLHGTYNPLISNAIFHVYDDVSGRSQILKALPLSEAEIRELLNAFYSVCQWVPIYYLWRPNVKDEGDNFLIEELSTQALAEFDSEIRFRALAATGDTQRGLELLGKLDQHFEGG